jgi:hypothetical protein
LVSGHSGVMLPVGQLRPAVDPFPDPDCE